jgi:hypothetical protein
MPTAIAQKVCTHHWIIAPPEGPISEGVCKICNARQMFPNSIEEGYSKGVFLVAELDDDVNDVLDKIMQKGMARMKP